MSCFPPNPALLQFLESQGFQPSNQNLAPIEEALCHSSSGQTRNHEKLEFLGDAVLRLACAEFLEHRNPQLAVGERSSLRAQLVSDRWLAELAQQLQLDQLIQKGPSATNDSAAQATIRAECCEALVGAIYQCWGLDAARLWLEPHWQLSCLELEADPHLYNWKSALQEWSQASLAELPEYQSEERNRSHGNPQRFFSQVSLKQKAYGSGWGASRREAEQQAAKAALAKLKPQLQ
jgi:ribonuclease III